MVEPLLIAAMVAVVVGFAALAATDSQAVRESRPRARLIAVLAWWAILVAGWLAFAYVALVMPGGLDAAWEWTRAQPVWMQWALWLFLLPWMLALWVSQRGWSPFVSAAAIIGIAALWFVLALQLSGRKRVRG